MQEACRYKFINWKKKKKKTTNTESRRKAEKTQFSEAGCDLTLGWSKKKTKCGQLRLTSLAIMLTNTAHKIEKHASSEFLVVAIWAASWQNQQNDMWAQQRLRSAWASAQSDQSLLFAWRKLGSLATHWAHSEGSDQTGRILLVLSWGSSFELWARAPVSKD